MLNAATKAKRWAHTRSGLLLRKQEPSWDRGLSLLDRSDFVLPKTTHKACRNLFSDLMVALKHPAWGAECSQISVLFYASVQNSPFKESSLCSFHFLSQKLAGTKTFCPKSSRRLVYLLWDTRNCSPLYLNSPTAAHTKTFTSERAVFFSSILSPLLFPHSSWPALSGVTVICRELTQTTGWKQLESSVV